MAKSPRPHSKPKTNVLLSCFGFSGKLPRFKPHKPAHDRKTRQRLFSWIRLHPKPPSSLAKGIAVPGTSSMTGKPKDRNLCKPDSAHFTSGSIAPTTSYRPPNENLSVAVPDEVKRDSIAEKLIFENCDYPNSPKKLTGQTPTRFSLSRRFESFRSCRFTQPASPTTKKNLKPTTPAISHSLSFPTRRSRVEDPWTDKRVTLNKVGEAGGKRYRPAGGVPVMIIMLAIMIVWGKLCAILCTAAWLFMATSLRSTIKEGDSHGFGESDSYSEWVKKKLVTFKGFRTQRENLFKKS